jgi:hypothetical protein
VKRIYRQPAPLGRDDLEQARANRDVTTICEAVFALPLTDPDRQWMERQLVELMRDTDGSVRSIAALAVGHVARVHGQIGREVVMPVLQDLLGDSEAGGNAATLSTTSACSFGGATWTRRWCGSSTGRMWVMKKP